MPRPRAPYVDEATERRRAQGRAYYYRAKESGKVDDYVLRRRYGITKAMYDMLEVAQDGRCAICRKPANGHGRLHVDHDHESGDVRGLLCFMCNYALGCFQDDPAILRAAAGYLRQRVYAKHE